MQNAIDVLKLERSKLDQAIQLLEGTGTGKRLGRPRKDANDMPIALSIPKRKGRRYSAAQKKAQSIATKARWAKIKAVAKKAAKA